MLHGGPRYFQADEALAGYRGVGIGGGATFDLNLKVFSMFVDFNTDLLELHGDGRTYVGKLPGIMIPRSARVDVTEKWGQTPFPHGIGPDGQAMHAPHCCVVTVAPLGTTTRASPSA